jgi:predicted transposase YdaD
MHISHDAACKRLFAHPELVCSLLGLVPGCPVKEAALLEKVNCSFVSASDRQRNADMVWRVDFRKSSFYALVEFQSSPDWQMDQRMKVYAGLLSQDLRAQHKRELFHLLPVVVYSGRQKWHMPAKRPPSWLKRFQDGMVYFLIDEERAGDSVIGDVIRLVRGDALAGIAASVRHLLAWPMASEELRQDVCSVGNERAAVFGANLEDIMEDEAMAKISPELTAEEKRSVVEMYRLMYMTMKDTPELKKLAETWADGRNAGVNEGREEGRQEGLQEGRAEAFRDLLDSVGRGGRDLPHAKNMAIANADVAQLENWVRRVLAGEKLEDVLAEGSP